VGRTKGFFFVGGLTWEIPLKSDAIRASAESIGETVQSEIALFDMFQSDPENLAKSADSSKKTGEYLEACR
jgi:hypothetical protein